MDSTQVKFKQMSDGEKRKFFQSKFEYYKLFTKGLLVVATLTYITFFVTDCLIFGRFSYETFIPRAIIIVPLVAFLYANKRIDYYKPIVILSYAMVHLIIILTDVSTYLLPDREFASEGMIIMNLIFVCAGFSAPFRYSLIAHCLLIVDIVIAHMFIHYDNIVMMLLFNIPCVFATCVMHHKMQKLYFEHYLVTDKLQKLVVHDQLTGMYNRNMLDELSDQETEILNFPQHKDITVLILDIDFFKKVNDVYGHESGDIVLKHTASVVKRSVRTSDYVIRWGGEEFIVLLVGCKLDMGMMIAEKIRINVSESDNNVCPVTVSIGVAEYDGGNYHDTIELADVALYSAKTNGRNRVVKYEEGIG